MVRLKFSIELNYQVADAGCDFIFNIHAAQTREQTLLSETLGISQILRPEFYTDGVSRKRYLKFRALASPTGCTGWPSRSLAICARATAGCGRFETGSTSA